MVSREPVRQDAPEERAPAAATARGESAIADARPQAAAQRKLQEIADASPQSTQLKARIDMMLGTAPTQRAPAEKPVLQGKGAPLQGVAPATGVAQMRRLATDMKAGPTATTEPAGANKHATYYQDSAGFADEAGYTFLSKRWVSGFHITNEVTRDHDYYSDDGAKVKAKAQRGPSGKYATEAAAFKNGTLAAFKYYDNVAAGVKDGQLAAAEASAAANAATADDAIRTAVLADADQWLTTKVGALSNADHQVATTWTAASITLMLWGAQFKSANQPTRPRGEKDLYASAVQQFIALALAKIAARPVVAPAPVVNGVKPP